MWLKYMNTHVVLSGGLGGSSLLAGFDSFNAERRSPGNKDEWWLFRVTNKEIWELGLSGSF